MRALVDRMYGTSLLPATSKATASASAAARTRPRPCSMRTSRRGGRRPVSARPATVSVDTGMPVTFDRVRLQEYIALGQRVSLFEIEAFTGGTWKRIATGTTIGHTRIVATAVTTASRVRVRSTRRGASR